MSLREYMPLGTLSYQVTHARREVVRDTCETKFELFLGSESSGPRHNSHYHSGNASPKLEN